MIQSLLRTTGKGARNWCALYSTAKKVSSQPRDKWPPTIGIVLSGCGAMDGSEIHEAVSLQTQLEKHCAKYMCYAPDEPQVEVVNSLTETPMKEKRNVIAESSRLTQGTVKPLEQLDSGIDELDAVVFCGGQGAVNNLSSFFRDTKCPMSVHANVRSIIKKCRASLKPMGFISETSIIAANELPGVRIALGKYKHKRDRREGEKYKKIADALGARVSSNNVTEVCCDYDNRVFSVPAFMCRKSEYHDVYDGIGNMIRVMLATMKYGID